MNLEIRVCPETGHLNPISKKYLFSAKINGEYFYKNGTYRV